MLSRRLLVPLLCLCLNLPAWAQGEVDLYLFWSLRCPHCLEARPQVQELAERQPWLHLHEHEITQSPENLERFVAMARELGEEAQSVPTLIYCGRMEVGWDERREAKAALLARLEACRDDSLGTAKPVASATLNLPLIGEIDPASASLPLLTLLLAGLDAFNPCAFFVLLFLLSLLVHQHQRRRMLLIGGVFVAFSGIMYFAFMAAWLNLFLVVGSLHWVTAGAGLVALLIGIFNIKDFIAFKRGPSLSITEERKADIFQRGRRILAADNLPTMLTATIVLAIAANFYELLCTAGFPMVFTRLLTLREHGLGQHYLYLALYNVIYVLPLLVIVLAFVRSMGTRKLSERDGRLLKLLSGLMMAALGAVMLVAPEHLDRPAVALALPGIAVALTWLIRRYGRF